VKRVVKNNLKNRGNPITPQGAQSFDRVQRLPAGFYFSI